MDEHRVNGWPVHAKGQSQYALQNSMSDVRYFRLSWQAVKNYYYMD